MSNFFPAFSQPVGPQAKAMEAGPSSHPSNHTSSNGSSEMNSAADPRRPVIEDEFRTPIDEAAKALALAIAEAADDRKAGDITILQTCDISYLADYFVIVTGFSNVQVRAIANAIDHAVAEKFGREPLRTEGVSEGRWILKDYGEVIAHIFLPADREYYDLEAFWGHATRLPFTPSTFSAIQASSQAFSQRS